MILITSSIGPVDSTSTVLLMRSLTTAVISYIADPCCCTCAAAERGWYHVYEPDSETAKVMDFLFPVLILLPVEGVESTRMLVGIDPLRTCIEWEPCDGKESLRLGGGITFVLLLTWNKPNHRPTSSVTTVSWCRPGTGWVCELAVPATEGGVLSL